MDSYNYNDFYKSVKGLFRSKDAKMITSKKEIIKRAKEQRKSNPKNIDRFIIDWECYFCGKQAESQLNSLKQSKHSHFSCISCLRKKENPDYYSEIKKFVETRGAKLANTKKEINSQIINVAEQKKIQRAIQVGWICKCGKIKHVSWYGLLRIKDKKILECMQCSKFENKINRLYIEAFEKVEQHLTKYDAEIITTREDIMDQLDKLDNISDMYSKLVITWKCECSNTSTNTARTLLRKDSKIICKICSHTSMKWKEVVEFFNSKEWTLLSKKHVYKNKKTLLECKCPQGHKTTKSVMSLQNNRNCKICENMSMKIPYKIVKSEFKKRGMKFLYSEKEYLESSKLKYLCKCNITRYITWSNLRRNKKGCKLCAVLAKCNDYDDVKAIFEKRNCILLSTTYTNNSSPLEYICWCGTQDTISFKNFVRGSQCKKCAAKSRQDTCIEKYGVDNPFKAEQCKEKIKNTMKERYGVEYNMQSEEIKKGRDETNVKRYGDKMYLKSQKFREECLRKFDCLYPCQNKQVRHKVLCSAFGTKKYKFPSGNVILVQGFENHGIDDFIDNRDCTEPDFVFMDDEGYPVINYRFKKMDRKYFCDFYIPKYNLIVEVKSVFTMDLEEKQNFAKMRACVENGYNAIIVVYDDKGKLVKEYKFEVE